MYCGHCGNKLSEADSFCPNCGAVTKKKTSAAVIQNDVHRESTNHEKKTIIIVICIILITAVAITSVLFLYKKKSENKEILNAISSAIEFSFFKEPTSSFHYEVETRWDDHCDDKNFEGIMEIDAANRCFETSGDFTALSESGEYWYGWEYYIDYGNSYAEEKVRKDGEISSGYDYDEVSTILESIFDCGGDYRILAMSQIFPVVINSLPEVAKAELQRVSDEQMQNLLSDLFSKESLITVWGYEEQSQNGITQYSFEVDCSELLAIFEQNGFQTSSAYSDTILKQVIEVDDEGYITKIVVDEQDCLYSIRFNDYQKIGSIKPDWAN